MTTNFKMTRSLLQSEKKRVTEELEQLRASARTEERREGSPFGKREEEATESFELEKRLALEQGIRERLAKVEELLQGQRLAPDLFIAAGKKAANVMLDSTGRRWSTEYKEIAIQGLVEQALTRVLGESIHA